MGCTQRSGLYGWALTRQYTVGVGSVERAGPLPDPMDGGYEWCASRVVCAFWGKQ